MQAYSSVRQAILSAASELTLLSIFLIEVFITVSKVPVQSFSSVERWIV